MKAIAESPSCPSVADERKVSPLSAPVAASPLPVVQRPGGLWQKLVCAALRPMQRGRLRLTLPDGSQQLFGSGDEVEASIEVVRPEFFRKCALRGDVGFGDAFVDGDWKTDDLVAVISWFVLNADQAPTLSGSRRRRSLSVNWLSLANRLAHLLRPNTRRIAKENIRAHYDLGNDLYKLFLDPSLTYSSALFSSTDQPLELAQEAKLDALCQALRLQPGERVLEIGCGWGSFAIHAARRYGVSVTAVTISEAQRQEAVQRVAAAGLEHRIEVVLRDYRDLTGQFDKIASIEMLEAVGDRYLETFFATCDALLAPGGLVGLQMITCADRRHAELKRGADFIQLRVFPGSLLLSPARLLEASRRASDLNLLGWRDFGPSYGETLRRWRESFNQRIDEVRQLGYDGRFIRLWNYYLAYCQSAFSMRHISVAQAVFSRPNNRALAPF
jgi:cyclopropane-fatty-acyl-phospholipid synthase